jgi:hypothetical protein
VATAQLTNKPKRPGRHTRKTPEACQQIIEVVRTGLPLKFAAASVGVTDEAVRLWREKDSEFSEKVELARLASVKERWEIIQAAARGNGETPGDWHAAAWSVERTWPQDFGRPEAQLNIQNNVSSVTNNNAIHITFEVAERLDNRGHQMEVEIEKLIDNRKPAPGV